EDRGAVVDGREGEGDGSFGRLAVPQEGHDGVGAEGRRRHRGARPAFGDHLVALTALALAVDGTFLVGAVKLAGGPRAGGRGGAFRGLRRGDAGAAGGRGRWRNAACDAIVVEKNVHVAAVCEEQRRPTERELHRAIATRVGGRRGGGRRRVSARSS